MILYQQDDFVIRPVTNQDALDLYGVVLKNKDHLRQWLSWVSDDLSLEDMMTFTKHCELLREKNLGRSYLLTYQDQIIGFVDFHMLTNVHRNARIGYWLIKEAQGRGFMTLSVKKLIEYGFHHLKLHRIEIRVATGNEPSKKIPQRLGFVKEGELREVEWLYDHFVNHEVYSLLSTAWRSF